MKRVAVHALLVVAASLLAACAAGPSADKPREVNTQSLPQGASAAAQSDSPLAAEVLKAVNTSRAKRGAAPLSNDGSLQRAAAVHAADMQLRNFYGHHNPDGQGPRERVLAVSPAFKGSVAENIQVVEGARYAAMNDAQLAAELVGKWATSPQHRRNMQSPDFTRSGIGIARSGQKIIAVQVFSGP
ncbi:MAG: CAP domain-containing protein [Alphaproteobacteria bacterium]|nr:CAP domain-containing protein [Alphaproteobacteria bacterium]MDX5416529.1 CAP domain-containing protein [Alphaproteobacteria bacterium]MDX5493888.1 CAP domain-containing protein [Alphaproteobacteria bacterium]